MSKQIFYGYQSKMYIVTIKDTRIWTFDSSEKVGAFLVLNKATQMDMTIYESGVNSWEPAKISLRTADEFIAEAISGPARRCMQAQLCVFNEK
jgi:hypothetical protein